MTKISFPSTDLITSTVFKAYNSLPKNGKPRLRDSGAFEWTILAGICLCIPTVIPLSSNEGAEKEEPNEWNIECVSLGTGLRVLPYGKLPIQGDVLHDCHAEIVARRGFLVYLYDQLSLVAKGSEKGCHLEASLEGKWKLKQGIRVAMYVSTLPCGDASTYYLSLQATLSPTLSSSDTPVRSSSPKTPYSTTLLANSLGLNTSRSPTHSQLTSSTSSSTESTITTTTPISQVRRGRIGYSSLSSLRTKPGRIDSPPSISHSCSDKLALWCVIGLQGSLLSTVVERIKIELIIIGAVEEEKVERERIKEEVERALGGRLKGWERAEEIEVPEVRFTEERFRHGREKARESVGEEGEVVSCLTSISYIKSHLPERQIIDKGVKQGCPLKRSNEEALVEKFRSILCKLSLYNRYIEVSRLLGRELDENLSYYEAKQSCRMYRAAKNAIRGSGGPFEGWLVSGKKFESFPYFFPEPNQLKYIKT